jgi:hypothetical protein
MEASPFGSASSGRQKGEGRRQKAKKLEKRRRGKAEEKKEFALPPSSFSVFFLLPSAFYLFPYKL